MYVELFWNIPKQLTKAEVKKKLLLQLGYTKSAIQNTSYKKVSSDQKLNSIDSSWVDQPNVGQFVPF